MNGCDVTVLSHVDHVGYNGLASYGSKVARALRHTASTDVIAVLRSRILPWPISEYFEWQMS